MGVFTPEHTQYECLSSFAHTVWVHLPLGTHKMSTSTPGHTQYECPYLRAHTIWVTLSQTHTQNMHALTRESTQHAYLYAWVHKPKGKGTDIVCA